MPTITLTARERQEYEHLVSDLDLLSDGIMLSLNSIAAPELEKLLDRHNYAVCQYMAMRNNLARAYNIAPEQLITVADGKIICRS